MAVCTITLSIQDADGDVSSALIHFVPDEGDTITSLSEDYAYRFWDAVRPLVNGVLVGVSVAISVDFSDWMNNSAAPISDVEEKVTFTLRVCGGSRSARLTLPTAKESIFANGGASSLVDTTNVDFIYFDHMLSSGVVDGGINATDRHGTDICQVLDGVQKFGKR